jgi:hypothetical protein
MPTWGRSIVHTSVVFKLKLEGGLDAAYKPRSRRGGTRYKGEIGDYRHSVALGLPNVPPAIARSFPLAALSAALGGEDGGAGPLLDKEAVPEQNGEVAGALIPWIPHLGFLALEADPLLTQWKSWLASGSDIPSDRRALARQISDLIVFDYVTGNWDRWSGGNVGLDKDHDVVLFIDNDGAFYDAPPAGPLAAQQRKLEGVARFSRSLVEKLRRLDDKGLATAIGDERPGVPLLGPKALAGVLARRDKALKWIDGRVAALGDATVLSFE